MDMTPSTLILMVFIVAVLAFIWLFGGNVRISGVEGLVKAKRGSGNLTSFLQAAERAVHKKGLYLFTEENVVSMTYRFSGRLDAAIVGWNSGPVLDAIVERKFPRRYLPTKAYPEDVFQGSLYALALKEKGFSVSSTHIVAVYCIQDEAEKCMQRGTGLSCLTCGKGKLFVSKLKERAIAKAIGRLDEVWYRGRKPRPNPSVTSCRRCPFSTDGTCNFTAV
jgi:hypothetical protein